MNPLVALVNGSTLLPLERGYIKSVVSGGQWPQHRQWECGLSNSAECRACMSAPCTLAHRHLSCAAHEQSM
eukprot:6444768-Pyramimonas_sp.AAC.1